MTKTTYRLRRTHISTQLNRLLATVMLPLLIITGVLLSMLFSFNKQYESALQNANIAAQFNNDFKRTIDLDMWYHVVKAGSVEELPLSEVDKAIEVINRLSETTTQQDNRWRIRSMLNMCNNLRIYMIDIANTPQYDIRMEKLEKDIYSITQLIQTYMHDYIYDEVKEVTMLQQQIGTRVINTIGVTVVVVFIIFVIILAYSINFTKRITQPIDQLCQKVERLGAGDFTVEPIETKSQEIKTLDDGFNKMVGRINALMEREREDQSTLRRTELELLQAQINPHFLYNTLDSIVWLAETHRDKDVIKMVTSLSVFFRNSLSKGKDLIPLETEKDQVKSYLEIQEIRYSDIMEYEIDIPEEMLHYIVPKLVLQPLVENAIYHGIKNVRGGGKLIIRGHEEGENLILQVEDNGIGMTKERLEDLRLGLYQNNHDGLGIVNVDKRIKLYCGDEYGLSFESEKHVGTVVTVTLPKNIQDES